MIQLFTRQSKYLLSFARNFTYTPFDEVPGDERSLKEQFSRMLGLKLSANTKKDQKKFSKVIKSIKSPSIGDLGQTLMNVNYRIEYPQNLSEDQKKKMKRFDVFRKTALDSKDSSAPYLMSYYIDINQCGPMYLDALIKIKNEIDPTLTFRRSCREGICGSCAMALDGRHHLACIFQYPQNLDPSCIGPLNMQTVVKDLVVDMTMFYSQYKSIDPYLKRKTPKGKDQKEYIQTIENRAKIDGLYECVLCNSCSSSCPSYWWHPNEFQGPSILMQTFRWVIDSRDEFREERLEKIGNDMKLGECEQLGSCTVNCPKQLNPRRAIKELKELYEEYKKTKELKTVSVLEEVEKLESEHH